METILGIFGACGNIKKAEANLDEDASEIQLNAFEFRNYRTSLEDNQQKMLERIVNQTTASLVKGKTLQVNNFASKVFMDKDLRVLEYQGEYFPLHCITKMSFFTENEMQVPGAGMMGTPWGLQIDFDGRDNERFLIFNFNDERQRLNFALTLRILRTRDPFLDQSQAMEVDTREDEVDDDIQPFNKIVNTQHYNIEEAGIPIIFSIRNLNLYQKLRSTSRHVYLEFFVKYPSQDKFLYAKSPTTHIPPQVLQTEDAAFKKKKEKKDEHGETKQEEEKAEGVDTVLTSMKFELKNVKMKIPKVPHQIFGRLMAKDDYFPTAVGTFEFKVDKSMLQDRTGTNNKLDDSGPQEPKSVAIEMKSAMKLPVESKDKALVGQQVYEIQKIGQLNIRLLGYVTPPVKKEKEDVPKKKRGKDGHAGKDGDFVDAEDSEEEDEEEEETESEDNGGDNGEGAEGD